MTDADGKAPGSGAGLVDAGTDVADMDESTRADIAKMWAEAQAEFERITTRKLGAGRGIAFDQVTRVIQTRRTEEFEQPEEAKDVTGWQRASKIGDTMISCAKFFVGFAKQIAPYTVPGPSQPAVDLCSNALVMLLDVPGKIKEFNASIDNTFTKVATALEQIKMFGKLEKISAGLANSLHNLMVAFIKVCAHAIVLQRASKVGKVKAQLKNIMVGSDSGLADAVTHFETVAKDLATIVQTETYIASNKTLHLAVGIKADVGRMADQAEESAKKKKETSEREDRLKKIRLQLGLEDSAKISESNAQDAKARSKRLDGTLGWLTNDDGVYHAWRSQRGDSQVPLLVRGTPRSGKTTAVATMLQDLKDWASSRQQTSVAYHFFPTFVKKADEDPTPVLTGLKQMALQICEQDETMARILAESLPAHTNWTEPDEEAAGGKASERLKKQVTRLWNQQLRIGSPPTGASYFLVFDGIESMIERDPEAGKALLDQIFDMQRSAAPDSTVQIMVSGTEKTFVSYMDKEHMLIDMVSSNAEDMRRCIESELSKRQLFLNAKPGSPPQKARDMLLKDLPDLVHGQYSMLMSSLEKIEIRIKDERAQLNMLGDILNELQSSSVHDDLVVSLQQRLDPDDIRELNELLKWVMYGARGFTLDELEATLSLDSTNQPLTSLEYRISNKYASVFAIDSQSKVVAVREGIVDALRRPTRATKDGAETEAPRITATITIHNADLESTQNFLWELTINAARNKFTFEPSAYGSVRNLRKPEIGAHAVDAHLTLAQHGLSYLESEVRELPRPVGKYIVYYLPYHLARCLEEAAGEETDPDEASDSEKAGMNGKQGEEHGAKTAAVAGSEPPTESARKKSLGRATSYHANRGNSTGQEAEQRNKLTDGEKRDIIRSLEELFNDETVLERNAELFQLFSWNSTDAENFAKWINDDMVRQFKRSWLNTVTAKSPPLPGFFRGWVEKIGDFWLRGRDWPVATAWKWARAFYIMNSKLSNSHADKDSESAEVKAEEVAEWYQKTIFKIEEDALASLWYERLADTISKLTPRNQDAISIFKKALDRPNPSWTVRQSLAMVYKWEDETEHALEQAELVKDQCPEKEKTEAELVVATLLLKKAETAERGIAMLNIVNKKDPGDVKTWSQLAQAFAFSQHSKSRDELVNLTQRLCDNDFKAANDSMLVAVLRSNVSGWLGTTMLAQMLLGLAGSKKHQQAFLEALEKIWATTTVGSERDGFEPENPPWMAEDPEGVVAYREAEAMVCRSLSYFFLGLISYHHPEFTQGGREAAVKTWEKVLEARLDTSQYWGGSVNCKRALAFHYEAELAKPGTDEIELVGLLKKFDLNPGAPSNDLPLSKCVRAAFYTRRSRKDDAMDVLRDHVKVAINILTDADEANDSSGYFLLAQISLLIGDITNAMSAFCLLGEADHVKYLKTPKQEVLDDPQGWEKSAFRREIRRIRDEVLRKVEEKVPDGTKQMERLAKAADICQEMADALPPLEESADKVANTTAETTDGSTSVDGKDLKPDEQRVEAFTRDMPAAERKAEGKDATATQDTLSRDQAQKLPYVRLGKWFRSQSERIGKDNWPIYGEFLTCDSRWEYCEGSWGFQQHIYKCTVCGDRAFCEKHCKELCDPDRDEMDTFHICRKTHQWVKLPAWGHAMYEVQQRKGLANKKAKRVLMGGQVPLLSEHNTQVYDGAGWEGWKEVDGDVWLESIRDMWGIKKEESAEQPGEEESKGKEGGESSDDSDFDERE